MALCAKFSRYTTLNILICRGKSHEGSDRARCYALGGKLIKISEATFVSPLALTPALEAILVLYDIGGD